MRDNADGMFQDVWQTIRRAYHCVDVTPLGSVIRDEVASMGGLWFVNDASFDKDISPDRTSFEHDEELESSQKMTVLDEGEIMRESVVDRSKVVHKFEKCRIDAKIKNTRADTTGNHIPLPVNWHDLFNGNTTLFDRGMNTRLAAISIVASPEEQGTAPSEADGRSPVVVHVYFLPSFTDAGVYAGKLRGAALVRPNVFSVTVWKREPQLFVAKLQARHDSVTQTWGRVP
jgi:hypothetical protein